MSAVNDITTASESQRTPSLSTKVMNTSPTFTIFRRLPLELQLAVWKEAALAPQIIELVYRNNSNKALNHSTRALILTCVASNAAVRRYCTGVLIGLLRDPVYINTDTDVVVVLDTLNTLHPCGIRRRSLGNAFHGIQRFAIADDMSLKRWVLHLSILGKDLQTLFLVQPPKRKSLASKQADTPPPAEIPALEDIDLATFDFNIFLLDNSNDRFGYPDTTLLHGMGDGTTQKFQRNVTRFVTKMLPKMASYAASIVQQGDVDFYNTLQNKTVPRSLWTKYPVFKYYIAPEFSTIEEADLRSQFL